MYNYTFTSKNENDTKNFAKNFAKNISNTLKNKAVIVLTGELGSGKTKFTEGFLSYFGLENEISSPTFTIVNEYHKNEEENNSCDMNDCLFFFWHRLAPHCFN